MALLRLFAAYARMMLDIHITASEYLELRQIQKEA